MSIEDTIKEFASIWKTVFVNDALEPIARSAKLEDAVKAPLKGRGMLENCKL
jgi:hypothetical protein